MRSENVIYIFHKYVLNFDNIFFRPESAMISVCHEVMTSSVILVKKKSVHLFAGGRSVAAGLNALRERAESTLLRCLAVPQSGPWRALLKSFGGLFSAVSEPPFTSKYLFFRLFLVPQDYLHIIHDSCDFSTPRYNFLLHSAQLPAAQL